MPTYSWQRNCNGSYEVSSRGDKTYSAFNAVMPDGRTIEQHYQCNVKGYQPGGKDWRLGKGKPPLDKSIDLWNEYLKLWKIWSEHNPMLISSLKEKLRICNTTVLSDMFATTPINQARALAKILNEHESNV